MLVKSVITTCEICTHDLNDDSVEAERYPVLMDDGAVRWLDACPTHSHQIPLNEVQDYAERYGAKAIVTMSVRGRVDLKPPARNRGGKKPSTRREPAGEWAEDPSGVRCMVLLTFSDGHVGPCEEILKNEIGLKKHQNVKHGLVVTDPR